MAGVQHVAIIMDGNGRWAAQRGRTPLWGHRAGLTALQRTVQACLDQGIRYLTVYAFSTENWRRPPREVKGLLSLFAQGLQRLQGQTVALRVIGDLTAPAVPVTLRQQVYLAQQQRPAAPALEVLVAFNYGGRDELTRALRQLAWQVQRGQLEPTAITPEVITRALDTAGVPDPDLIIRTGGDFRTSNFLPWQSVYSEYVILPTLWPDFTAADLQTAVASYQQRQRRFGGRPEPLLRPRQLVTKRYAKTKISSKLTANNK